MPALDAYLDPIRKGLGIQKDRKTESISNIQQGISNIQGKNWSDTRGNSRRLHEIGQSFPTWILRSARARIPFRIGPIWRPTQRPRDWPPYLRCRAASPTTMKLGKSLPTLQPDLTHTKSGGERGCSGRLALESPKAPKARVSPLAGAPPDSPIHDLLEGVASGTGRGFDA